MKERISEIYENLKQEAEFSLGRKLIEKEKHFLQWLAEKHVKETKKR